MRKLRGIRSALKTSELVEATETEPQIFLRQLRSDGHYSGVMAKISFALLEAHTSGASIGEIAARLNLTDAFVEERIEAARLCLLIGAGGRDRIHQ